MHLLEFFRGLIRSTLVASYNAILARVFTSRKAAVFEKDRHRRTGTSVLSANPLLRPFKLLTIYPGNAEQVNNAIAVSFILRPS